MDISLFLPLSLSVPLKVDHAVEPSMARFCSKREDDGGENPRSKFVKTTFSSESGNNGMPRRRRK